MNNPVGWFEIYVDDTTRAKTFYEAVLGVRLEQLPNQPGPAEMWTFPMDTTTVGAAGALVRMDGFAAGNNSVLVYFKCDDCAVEAKKAVDAGGSIEKDKFSIGDYGFIALVYDTERNMIGLHSMK